MDFGLSLCLLRGHLGCNLIELHGMFCLTRKCLRLSFSLTRESLSLVPDLGRLLLGGGDRQPSLRDDGGVRRLNGNV